MHPVNKTFIDGMLYALVTDIENTIKCNKYSLYEFAKFKYEQAKEIEKYDA